MSRIHAALIGRQEKEKAMAQVYVRIVVAVTSSLNTISMKYAAHLAKRLPLTTGVTHMPTITIRTLI